MSELPSLLKSPAPMARQLDPGLGLTAPPPIRLVSLISQIEAWPLAFCHRIFKSGVAPGSGGVELTDTWLVTGADALTPSLTDQVIVRLEVVALAEAYVMESSSAL